MRRRATLDIRDKSGHQDRRDSKKPHWWLSAWFDQRGYAWFDQRLGALAPSGPRASRGRGLPVPAPAGRTGRGRRGALLVLRTRPLLLFGPRRSALSTTIATTSRQQWTIGRQGQAYVEILTFLGGKTAGSSRNVKQYHDLTRYHHHARRASPSVPIAIRLGSDLCRRTACVRRSRIK